MPGSAAARAQERVRISSIEPTAVYSISDVENLLDVSRKTVLRLIEERQLAAARVGRQYRIPGAFLLEFLAKVSTDPSRAEAALARFMPVSASLLLAVRETEGPAVSEEEAARDALDALARVRYQRR